MITLEGYKIIKKIASGGMGDVYLGEHEKLEKKVAIKSLHKNLATDTSFRERFSQEAKTHATLDHPNIVKLLDYKESKEGLFLIMEYVDGKQLDEHIKKVTGPIPEKELIALFAQVLDAIGYAHEEGLVHRDIKPSNIMIDKKGRIKVLDFGIAKMQEQEKGLTKTGVQIGTASYMSPEQVNAEKLDKLTDIYSLGVTFFYMAVGKSPYDEDTNTFRIQTKIVSEPFPTAKEFYPGVSEKIEKIINKATQKKKADRYQSCKEFQNDLKSSVLESNSSTIKKSSVSSKSKVPNPLLIACFSLVVLIFGIGIRNESRIEKRTEDVTEIPLQISVNASSVLPPSYGYTYPANNTMDHDMFTWWSPSKSLRNDAWIEYSFNQSRTVAWISIHAGSHYPNFPNLGDLYWLNLRIRKASVVFTNGYKEIINLDDIDAMQDIYFKNPIKCEGFRLELLDYYPSDKWKDYCISELTPIIQ